MKKLKIGVINITTQPHSPQTYVELFNDVFNEEKIADYYGSDKLMFTYLNTKKLKEKNVIYGSFSIFVEIDKTAPVLNIKTKESIVSQNGEYTINIPDNLKPNQRIINFVFFPDGHRLFFHTVASKAGKYQNNISPSCLAKSIGKLFNSLAVHEKYGEVNVVVEQEKKSLDDILSFPQLQSLSIFFALPNSDDRSEEEERIVKKLELQGANRFEQELSANKGKGIKPDDETKALMSLATSNGKVVAKGRDAKQEIKTISTDSFPLTRSVAYIPNKSIFEQLYNAGSGLISSLTGKKN